MAQNMVSSTVIVLLVVTSTSFAYPAVHDTILDTLSFPTDMDIGSIDSVVDGLQQGVVNTKEIFSNIKEHNKALDALVKEADEKIAFIVQEIGITASKKVSLTRDAINLYHEVKLEIWSTRTELRELATQTVQSCDALTIYMEGWGEDVEVEEKRAYLKEQLQIMKDLVAVSKNKLTAAKASYKKSIEKLGLISQQMHLFQNEVDAMLLKESAQHKAWTTGVRAGFYSGAGAITVSMAVADVMGCSGLCSGIVSTSTIASTIAAVELKIAQVTAKLKELEENVEAATDDVDSVGEAIGTLEGFLVKETAILVNWLASVKTMDTTIQRASYESFSRLPVFREIFTASLMQLQDAAQLFLDQPVLFSNEIEDEERQQKESGRAEKDKEAIEAISQQRQTRKK